MEAMDTGNSTEYLTPLLTRDVTLHTSHQVTRYQFSHLLKEQIEWESLYNPSSKFLISGPKFSLLQMNILARTWM